MEFMEVVEARRSVRAYKTDAVPQETVEKVIRAAQLAPTWKNSQTGRYYVIMSEEKRAEFREKCLPEFNANNCKDAPVLIVCTFEANRAGFNREGIPDNELGNEWGAYDLGLQTENLVLAAKNEGLDTLIMGIRDGEAIRAFLGVPESQHVVSVISMGYRDIDPEMPKRKELEKVAVFL